ncbi:MAG: sensor histidine kinase, partial [Anaerolineae bacterium]
PDQSEQIDQLTASVASAKTMVDNLVKFATFVNKQGELRLDSFDFAELVTQALTPLRPFAQSKDLVIHLENGSSGQPPANQPITADRELLGEAIHHLLHNAFKFTEEGGKVWVRAWAEDGRICFEVQDNGMGIPAEKQADIWSDFVQMADPLRRGREGLGLGLPLVKYIIEAHDGQVYLESREHVGSIFGFKLPGGGAREG